MLSKIVVYLPFRLFTTMLLLYICLGMHFIHPSFHDFSENDGDILNHCKETLFEELAMEENHFCPLCVFLTVNHFFLNPSEASIDGHQYYDQIEFAGRLLILKAYSEHIEPRASPYFL